VDQHTRFVDGRLRWIRDNINHFIPKNKSIQQLHTFQYMKESVNRQEEEPKIKKHKNLTPKEIMEINSKPIEYSDKTLYEEAEEHNPIKLKGTKSYCPASVSGSRRFLREKARNALHILTQLGQHEHFLTLTCNIDWEEFKILIPPGTSIYHRSDIVSEVFKNRLNKMLYDLRNGYFHNERKTMYDIYVIEYQNRGLPHAHIVYKLSK